MNVSDLILALSSLANSPALRPGPHGGLPQYYRILTSDSPRILDYRGAFSDREYERMKEAVLEEMRHHFRPEFLNRVDEIIVFHALSEEHLTRRSWRSSSITLELTDAARLNLVRTGYDPNYGARPLERAIQKKIETPLRRLILKGEIHDGQRVMVNVDREGELTFYTAPVELAAP